MRFLIALAKEKHFRKASEVCHISQPSLSIAIRKLEEKLGVTLFERNKNEVRVTDLGKQIIERAKRILEEVESIKQVALSDKDQLSSVLRLGAIYTVGPYILPSLITKLHKSVPQMPIEIQEDYTVNLRKKLINGEVDAIIVSAPFTAPGVVVRTLYKEPFVVLLPAKHPLAKYKTVNESDLINQNVLLLGEGHCFRDQIIASCPHCFNIQKADSGVNWKTVEGSSLETIRHMVASGLGVTILPSSAASTSPYKKNMLTARPLKGSQPERKIILAWRATFPRIKSIELILKSINRI